MQVWKTWAACLLAVSAVLVSGCALSGAPALSDEPPVLEEVESVGYVLGADDKLRILVFGVENLSGEFVVGPTGMISYPLLGDIQASGKTVEQFARFLEGYLKPNYVREPKVSVEVLNYRPFYILGEVRNSGTFPFTNGLTVMNAVATAGGFTYRADSQRVYIKHAGDVNEREYRLTSGTPVRPGDTVRIAERRF